MNTEQFDGHTPGPWFCFCCGGEVSADELLEQLKHRFPEYVDEINEDPDGWLDEGEGTTVCCDDYYGTKEQLHEQRVEGLDQWSSYHLMQGLYDLVIEAGHIESMANEERRFLAAGGEDAREDDDDKTVAWSRIQTFDRKALIGAIESYWNEREESE